MVRELDRTRLTEGEDVGEVGGSQGDYRISCPVVDTKFVGVLVHQCSSGKDHSWYIAHLLVGRVGTQHPLLTSIHEFPGFVQIKEGKTDPIQTSGGSRSDSMVYDEPSVLRFNRLCS